MVTLEGDIDQALAFGKTQIGKPYDHQANTEARFGLHKFDCSGFIIRDLWEGGMPRYHAGFGEGSASMAAWCEDNPQFRLSIDAAKNTRGALLVKGGTSGIGDLGHVVFSLGDGRTLESNGHRGVCIDDVNRLTWSHGLLAPVHYVHLEPEDIPLTPAQEAKLDHCIALSETVLAYIGERKALVHKPHDPPHVASDQLILDLHEFVLSENKVAILKALTP